MQRRYGALLLFTAGIVLAVAYGGFYSFHRTGLPFFVQLRDAHTAVVVPIPGVSLPGELHPGDQIDLAALSRPDRIAANVGWSTDTLPIGRTYTLAIRRDHEVVEVPVASGSRSAADGFITRHLLELLTSVFQGVVAILALWKGRDRVAASLALWMTVLVVGSAIEQVPADGMTAVGLRLGAWLLALLGRVGFYLMAESIAGTALRAGARNWWRGAFLVLLGIAAVRTLVGPLAFVATGWTGLLHPRFGFSLPACYLLAVALLFFSYRESEPASRTRLRWMLGSGAIFAAGIVVTDAGLLGFEPRLFWTWTLLQMTGTAGFLYATLRHRILDFTVVMNRALVYGATTSLVLGLFALFESLIERMALGKDADLLLEVAMPLVLGASLSTVHRRIDGLIDRLIFRRQYQEDVALREFGMECAFVTRSDSLLDLTVEEVGRYTGAPWVALYEGGPDGYPRVRCRGECHLPEQLATDDVAVVKLRAHGAELNLHGIASGLGPDGHAFPLRMRDRLVGVLVLGSRPGEHYSTEELELLSHVAHQVGAALFALRAEASEASLRDVRERAAASEARLKEAQEREQALLRVLRNADSRSSA